MKNRCLRTESGGNIERLAELRSKWNEQATERNIDFSRDQAEFFDVALDDCEVTRP